MYNYHFQPFTMQGDFGGDVYWDELAEICGDISRVVGFLRYGEISKKHGTYIL